ncbi:MAG: cold shock domain-containing protein [Nitrospirota bacterium]
MALDSIIIMPVPVEVVYKREGLKSEAVEAEIAKRAERLDRYYAGMLSCRVVVDEPHRRHGEGNLYHIQVELLVPGRKLVVTREHPRRHAHEDIFIALKDSFEAAERQLEEYSRVERHEIKTHEAHPHGTVAKLFPEGGYGFIREFGGREIYFHKNSVLDGFESLRVGDEVRFEEEEGEKGPQASTVKKDTHHGHHKPGARGR